MGPLTPDRLLYAAGPANVAGALSDAAPSLTVGYRRYSARGRLGSGTHGRRGVRFGWTREKALPAWFASLGDRHSSQYQVLTRLAQYSLAREPHVDKVATPKAAVSMAKKTSLVVVVIMALLTIYGTLI